MPTAATPHAAPALPLQRHRLFASRDVDEARDFVARVFCPHELSPLRGSALDACHHSARLHRDASLNYVQYGPAVRIEPGCLDSFYLLQMPLRGGATVRCGSRLVASRPGLASLPSPTEALSMQWHDDSPHLIVKLGRAALQSRLEALLQGPLRGPLVFDPAVDLQSASGAAVGRLVEHLRATVDDDDGLLRHGVLAEQAENHLLTTLLLALPHNHSAWLHGPGGGCRPATLLPAVVRRAQEYMSANAQQPLTLADVCNAVGTSARSLQQAFQRATGITPMAFLRDLRLDRVHAQLRSPDAAPVLDIAARHGFFHAGHFAAHYRRRFGEAPSAARRKG